MINEPRCFCWLTAQPQEEFLAMINEPVGAEDLEALMAGMAGGGELAAQRSARPPALCPAPRALGCAVRVPHRRPRALNA